MDVSDPLLVKELGDILKRAKGERIPAARLARMLRLYNEKPDTTHYPVRLVIKCAIEMHQMPIGSCSKGYYWITNDKDYMLTINDLKARRNGLDKRIRAIHKNYLIEKQRGQTPQVQKSLF